MAKTLNYNLTIYPTEETAITFKAWRNSIAGTVSDSNMQIIDSVLKRIEEKAEDLTVTANVYTDHQMQELKDLLNDYYLTSGDNIVIGGVQGFPIEFNDGSQISKLKNGIFSTKGIRLGNYLIRYTSEDDHLKVSYSPEGGED